MDHLKKVAKFLSDTLAIVCLAISVMLPAAVNAADSSTNRSLRFPTNAVAQPAGTLRMIARLEQFR